MRWRFPFALSPAEAEERAATLRNIDAWWEEFAAASSDMLGAFAREREFDFADFMLRAFSNRVHPGVMWEFGPAPDGHALAFSGEADRWLAPLVDVILARAPRVESFTFTHGRAPQDWAWAQAAVAGRTGGAIPPGVKVAIDPDEGIVGLTWQLAPGESADEGTTSRVFVATEALLGEAVLDTWIGPIEVVPAPNPGWFARFRSKGIDPDFIPSEGLKDAVDARIRKLQSDLPPRPLDETILGEGGTVFKLTPAAPPELEGRSDLFVAVTRLPQLWKACHRGRPFSSTRHSRFGEIFAYVKIDGRQGLESTAWADRGEIEDALSEALAAGGLGAVFGGGTGHVYSYIDLVLARPDEAIAVIRAFLQAGRICTNAWILFFDATLSAEWVGVWDHTPSPPRQQPQA